MNAGRLCGRSHVNQIRQEVRRKNSDGDGVYDRKAAGRHEQRLLHKERMQTLKELVAVLSE